MLRYWFALSFFTLAYLSNAQNSRHFPETGKPVPEFMLKNIKNFRETSVKNSDFKGRFLILDFWNKRCASCVESFPKMSELQTKFKDQVDVILVADQEDGIEEMYERYKRRFNLSLAAVFDSIVFKSFVHRGVPHVVMIDSTGIVKAITNRADEQMIQAFISGWPISFRDESYAQYQKEYTYDFNKPMLVDNNGGPSDAFQFRSLLANYDRKMKHMMTGTDFSASSHEDYPFKGRFEAVTTLGNLYRLAYLGAWSYHFGTSSYNLIYPRINLLVKDSAVFLANSETFDNFFLYSLIVPREKADSAYLTKVIQNDLQNYFGYKATVSQQLSPYWSITLTDKARKGLKTNGKRKFVDEKSGMLFKATNVSISHFFNIVFFHVYQFELPIIDESDMTDNIDIAVDFDNTNMQSIIEGLAKKGIMINKKEKQFTVLTISDK